MTIDTQNDDRDILLSGGAEGADLRFGAAAGRAGFDVVHWTFAGHRSRAPSRQITILSDAELQVADEFCLRANLTLKRHFPPRNQFAANLLRRNWYQVAWSDAIYAISTLERGMVRGGTAWATQMFLDRFDGQPCPAYLFCQELNQWHEWIGCWTPIVAPPRPYGIIAGVGSRDLKPSGEQAIDNLFSPLPA